jgi:hypothetical protein
MDGVLKREVGLAAECEDVERAAHELTRQCNLAGFGGESASRELPACEAVNATLMRIMKHQRTDLLVLLLDAGLPVEARFEGESLGSPVPKPTPESWSSLLMLCTKHQFGPGIVLLAERGADIGKSRTDYSAIIKGPTLLDAAIDQDWETGVDIILSHWTMAELYGEEMMAKRDGNQAPVGLFSTDNLRIVTRILGSEIAKKGLLRRASWIYDKPATVQHLIEAGCDINDPGQEPILAAATRGNHNVMQLLLEFGADTSVKNQDGRSVLQCAGKNVEVKQVLRAWRSGNSVSAALVHEASAGPTVAHGKALEVL